MHLPELAKRLARAADEGVERRMERLRGNPVLDRVMYTASELGDWGLVWHLAGAAQALRPGRPASSAARVSAILAAESVLVNGIVKPAFSRRRPVWEPGRPRPHRLRTPWSTSFPSGHASAAFTAVVVLSEDDPLAPLYLAAAVVVAASRVYVKIHHASDVVAGAALGAALGVLARRVWASPPGTPPGTTSP